MLINKEDRIKYLGFNDLWFALVGIIILSFMTDFLFSNSFVQYSLVDATMNWSISLLFSTLNWSVMRAIMIWLRKRYPLFKDNVKRIALVFFALLITILLVDYSGNFFLEYGLGQDYNPISRSQTLLPVVLISVMTIAIYEAIYFYVRLRQSIREEEQAKQLVVQAQLEALKNQARPHFLFNSLNTLRDIIDQNSKEDAREFVDQLSAVYRFILDSGSGHIIPLREELEFAQSYIHIQSERFGDNLIVNWNIPTQALDNLIAPMSLQLLLENAIKHNIIAKSKKLTINVTCSDDLLVVSNRIRLKSTQQSSTKLGLINIEKRYKLVSDRSVTINDCDGIFKVTVPLLTTSNIKKGYEYSNN